MISHYEEQTRKRISFIILILIFGTFIAKLVTLQILDESYEASAKDNYLRYVIKYPPRGEVYDRNGIALVQNKECYDLMVISKDIPKNGFDTTTLCQITNLSYKKLKTRLSSARYTPRSGYLISKYLTLEQKLLLDEINIPGFYTVSRTVRNYPLNIGGNLLGSIGEVTPEMLARNPEYTIGDYVGTEGIEAAYEKVLCGEKGLALHNIYTKGNEHDSIIKAPIHGQAITCTIDAKLQLLAERLMHDKVGAVVAIEPATGEILVMASSPTFDPNELVGAQRGNNYMKELKNPRNPLFNRAVKGRYPPGSTFKLANGLIGLEESVLLPQNRYPCHQGYTLGKIHVGCHSHPSPLDLSYAIATSCNAYFCYVFRNILENRKFGSVKKGFEAWREYVESFGFGKKLNSDFLGESSGFLPSKAYYDKKYRNAWNALTLLSLSIGQGELGCTPLQMANFAATIANRGYYYIPHIIRPDSQNTLNIDKRFSTKKYTMVRKENYDIIAQGMWRGVNVDGTCRLAALKGWDVCGKTGTAQNPRGKDHSTFISFAPLHNPKIAVAVYVEHGGFGADMAVPIATLLEEQYLTDTITRWDLYENIVNKQINYKVYDRVQK
ncbi:MAG: penicillin-binding protein 2 [Alistipes sp.]|nr:penicillin-binding protein 2 [Candidatus Alistipes equi]